MDVQRSIGQWTPTSVANFRCTNLVDVALDERLALFPGAPIPQASKFQNFLHLLGFIFSCQATRWGSLRGVLGACRSL